MFNDIVNSATELLSAIRLSFKLDSARLLEVSLQVNYSEIVILSGPSGSGKTTLLRTLARMHPRIEGIMKLEGKNCMEIPPVKWRRNISYLSQYPAMLPGTVYDNLFYPCTLAVSRTSDFNKQLAIDLMQELGIPGEFMLKDAAVLSGGEQARIALIRTLLAEPKIILADEITAPLDDKNAYAVVNLLNRWVKGCGLSVIVVAHSPERWEKVIDREYNIAEMTEGTE
ncbi:ATP-binding cassette domain-containing protein [bacterium]|nr:ATP-binding cassette domain-containing protein [FCB group bacterium]MBL7190804.1 ATP-binding cassette domain-containing protein [bacterium]